MPDEIELDAAGIEAPRKDAQPKPAEPVAIPDEIKLDADVRLKLEKDAETDIKKNPEIF